MDIENTPNKRKTPTPFEDNQNQEDQEATKKLIVNPHPKTRASTRKSRQKDPTERTKTAIGSLYKDQITRETKEFKKRNKRVRI